ncbi:hypothetical protein G6F37_011878 [Rhizopus arrhizus]|nr:hypothetical protein G6F38_011631 [Rhizopus arrhizus]KAG1146890.1 hypothetical protein G6F37_011878 [Rhizopus arrhizus]
MSMQFLYEDGQGHVDEHGVEFMDLAVDEELFAIETISSRTQFYRTNIQKDLILKYLNASAAARQLGIHNASAVLTELAESLRQKFLDLNVSRSTVYNFMITQCNLSIKQTQFHPVERISDEKIRQRYDWVQKWQHTDLGFVKNCVFLDESAFHVNLKRSIAWSRKGTPAIVTVPTTTANATSILSAISATGLINVSLRVPKRIKKRKLGHEIDAYSRETVAGHYLSFLKATLDEMDKYLEMKGHYLVMDNAPIHSSSDIGKYTNSGYRFVYLPPYSPELNLIEQFWSVVKTKPAIVYN